MSTFDAWWNIRPAILHTRPEVELKKAVKQAFTLGQMTPPHHGMNYKELNSEIKRLEGDLLEAETAAEKCRGKVPFKIIDGKSLTDYMKLWECDSNKVYEGTTSHKCRNCGRSVFISGHLSHASRRMLVKCQHCNSLNLPFTVSREAVEQEK